MEITDDFRPIEFLSKHRKGFSLVILLVTAYWLNYHGVTVPASEPFVKFEIFTERETYHLGEVPQAKFLIRNMMPFPIRIIITEDIFEEGKYANETKGFIHTRTLSENKTLDIKIDIGQAYGENTGMGFVSNRLGEIVFEYFIVGNHIKHSVFIVD